MKPGIHAQLYQKAKTTCSTCGAVYVIPTTVAEQHVEVCRNCHPVYTGKAQKDVRGGRVERFRKRMAKKSRT